MDDFDFLNQPADPSNTQSPEDDLFAADNSNQENQNVRVRRFSALHVDLYYSYRRWIIRHLDPVHSTMNRRMTSSHHHRPLDWKTPQLLSNQTRTRSIPPLHRRATKFFWVTVVRNNTVTRRIVLSSGSSIVVVVSLKKTSRSKPRLSLGRYRGTLSQHRSPVSPCLRCKPSISVVKKKLLWKMPKRIDKKTNCGNKPSVTWNVGIRIARWRWNANEKQWKRKKTRYALMLWRKATKSRAIGPRWFVFWNSLQVVKYRSRNGTSHAWRAVSFTLNATRIRKSRETAREPRCRTSEKH